MHFVQALLGRTMNMTPGQSWLFQPSGYRVACGRTVRHGVPRSSTRRAADSTGSLEETKER